MDASRGGGIGVGNVPKHDVSLLYQVDSEHHTIGSESAIVVLKQQTWHCIIAERRQEAQN